MNKKLLAVLISFSVTAAGAAGALTVGADAVSDAVSTADGLDLNEDGTVNNPEDVEIAENELSFWSLFTGGDGEWFGQIVDAYNATSPVNPVECITLVWDDYYTKLQTAVATGNGPDTGISHVSKLYELVETGVVLPIGGYLDELGIDLNDYYEEASLDAVTMDGEIYAIPLDTHCEVMYYNLDLLEEAGITEEEVLAVASEDDFNDILGRCKEALPEDVTPLAMTNNGDDPFRVWYAVYFQLGGADFVNEGATEVTLDEDAARQAMSWVKSLYENGYILPGIDDHSAIFQSGKAVFEFGGTWVTGAFEQTSGLNFNVAKFPRIFGDPAYCWADSHTLILPVNEKRTEEESLEAVRFLFYASNDGGLTWSGSGQIPSAVSANQSEEYKEKKGYNIVGELELAKYAPRAQNYYGGMKSDIINALDGCWQEVTDFDASYEALYEAIEENLD